MDMAYANKQMRCFRKVCMCPTKLEYVKDRLDKLRVALVPLHYNDKAATVVSYITRCEEKYVNT